MAVRFATDENFRRPIVRGLHVRRPDIDILHAQDAGLNGAVDPRILEWAAAEGRVLLTHDVQTMVGFARRRVADGLPMSGLVVIPFLTSSGRAVEEIDLLIGASFDTEWDGQIRYLPLR